MPGRRHRGSWPSPRRLHEFGGGIPKPIGPTIPRGQVGIKVPGFFQTEAYARALATSNSVGINDEAVERKVSLKLGQQKQLDQRVSRPS